MSTKSVAQKLQIKPKMTIWTSHPERLALVEPFPESVAIAEQMANAGIALVFADDSAALRDILDAQRNDLTSLNVLWVIYPKANRTDINRDLLWPILAEYGMRPNSQIAVDDVWSALRFRSLKEDEAPFNTNRN